MNKTAKMIGMLYGVGVFAGCASPYQGMEMKIVPTMKVGHSQESANGYYSLGRYHHGARRFDEAISAYERALELDARHAKARNAMGVLYAEIGKYAHAVTVLREATKAEPNNSQFYSNLGYASYLNGDYTDAAASLEQATRLDPTNVRAWNNLGSVMEKLGRRDRSNAILKRVQSIKDTLLLAASAGKEALHIAKNRIEDAILSPSAKSAIGQQDFQVNPNVDMGARTEVKQVGPSRYEVHQVADGFNESGVATSAMPPEAASQATPVAKPNTSLHPVSFRTGHVQANVPLPNSSIRLEISNGNGINGMARSVGKIIGGGILRVARLTNQGQFNVKTTRVEYSEGHEKPARALAAGFGPAIDIKQKNGIAGADIRVVLGRDLPNLGSLRAHFLDQLKAAGSGNGSQS